jgi:hypothetical protein
MHQQFTYEEATRRDAHRASHASDAMAHSAFRRHRRPLYHWFESLRERMRTPAIVIDLRDAQRPAMPFVGLPEFLDVPDPVAIGELRSFTQPKVE